MLGADDENNPVERFLSPIKEGLKNAEEKFRPIKNKINTWVSDFTHKANDSISSLFGDNAAEIKEQEYK